MYSICLRYAKCKEDANDVLQEGFIRVFKNIRSLRDKSTVEAWMKRIFINTSLRFIEKRNGLKLDFVETPCDSEVFHVEVPCEYNELLCMINDLPDGFRTVFNLYVMDGYSHKEIGQKLNISEATSRSQLTRARTVLQKKIKKQNIDLVRNEYRG
ncbi:MAG: RNA polymerase [Crocinitomicaceae bacterium]|nr:RNA polymerase [Crocinitomicaceae bacterium]|tara:strand:- start:10362 stop:10826 length:465 start_codon:yes stop_codon:yes gene_type:complete